MSKIKKYIKKFVFFIINIVPLNARIVIFESEDLGDNAKALYDRMIERNINKKYKLFWIVNDIEKAKQNNPEINFISIKSLKYKIYYKWFAKYNFYTHRLIGEPRRSKQIRCFLTHGTPIKDSRKKFWYPELNTDIISTSDEAADLRCASFEGGRDIARILGFPRNDLLLRDNNSKDRLNLNDYKKTIIWMPTFKHYNIASRQGSNFENEQTKDISMLDENLIKKLNDTLKANNSVLIIKFHPVQDLSYVPQFHYSNIKTYTNTDLYENNVSVYELLAVSDALITDFSSVYLDYLLCDKPIAFELGDMANYSRGFMMDNPLDYMPGAKLYNGNDLESFISSVVNNEDLYKQEREQLKKRMHKYCDDKSADRILEAFSLL